MQNIKMASIERRFMAKKIDRPAVIKAAGNKPKQILEYFGRVNSKTNEVSIAKMISPQGWVEPGQKPEFDEYTVVMQGTLKAKTIEREFEIMAGEGILIRKNEWVQYSTPYDGGAEYIAVCLPAFSPEAVHRDT
jgi:mannose-6-phosphate isomerase-like protein (cupin superfamily)